MELKEITVVPLSRKHFTVEVTSTDLISDLKRRIKYKKGFPPDQQIRLIFRGRQLEDSRTLGDYEIDDKVRIHLVLRVRGGGSTIAEDISLEGVESATRKLPQIEAFVFLIPLLQPLLLVLGSLRRSHHNTKFQLFLQLVYVVSAFLISNTISKMLYASFNNGLFPIWAVLLVKFYGGTDSISVYSIEDNRSAKAYNWILLGLLYSVINLFFMYQTFWLPLGVFLVLTGFKTWERAEAQNSASNGLVKDTKVIADFMTYEHQLGIEDFIPDEHELERDYPCVMARYNYLVQFEETNVCPVQETNVDPVQFEETNVEVHPKLYQKAFKNKKEVVTIGKIWQCKGELLRGYPNEILKDICLSFALFKLLCCRFAQYPLSEQAKKKLSKLIRKVLLSNDKNRIFRVIELELAFLHDSFYTKYPIIFRKGFPIHKFVELLVSIAGCCIAAFSLKNYEPSNQYLIGVTVFGLNVDKVVTGSAIVLIAVVEIGQFLLIICSDWAKVMLICCYVQHPNWQRSNFIGTAIRFICNRRLLKPWEEVLGQYSLLESFDYNPNALLYNSFTSAFMDIPRNGQKESGRIKLRGEVKQAVIRFVLKSRDRPVTIGLFSLQQNNILHDLIWACKLESPVHVIMVWHIATSLCEMKSSQTTSLANANFVVATTLSKYCAYLVAFCPRLLPYHAYSTEFIFDRVVCEAREYLEGCDSMPSRYQKMMELRPGEIILRRSAELAKWLIEMVEESYRWKILADFWAEMMLFVAISDDEIAHAEYLAKGGEFVTHLWVLLYHADARKEDWKEQDV